MPLERCYGLFGLSVLLLKFHSVTRLFSGLFGRTVNTVVPKQFSLAMLILFASVPKAKRLDLSVATQKSVWIALTKKWNQMFSA